MEEEYPLLVSTLLHAMQCNPYTAIEIHDMSLTLLSVLPILFRRYDIVMTHALEWPSLTCQWLPNVKKNVHSPTVQEHSLLLGTHTTGEQNYLMVASCHLPKEDAVIDNRTSKENQEDQARNAAKLYDEEKQEVGGFGTNGSAQMGKIEIRMKIRHDGEVNRARYMPQNHFHVASRGPSPPVYVWDLAKHPSFPVDEADNTILPQITCQGHSKEGYALSWSPLKEGWLASGSEDTTVCLWDTASAKDGICNATTILKGHTAAVEDVDWHAKDANLLASVSDDASLRIWDIRESKKPVHLVEKAHTADINCVAFNPQNEFILATGSADNAIGIWDVRNLKAYVVHCGSFLWFVVMSSTPHFLTYYFFVLGTKQPHTYVAGTHG